MQAQIDCLSRTIQQVRLVEDVSDFVKWIRGKEFTVKSQYRFLLEAPSVSSTLHHIWGMRAPPRVSFFT
jgi:hypothetical protein